MPSIGHVGEAGISVDALWGAFVARRGQIVRWVGLIGAAASLAACAQSSVTRNTAGFAPSARQAALTPSMRQAAYERARQTHVSVVRRHVPAPETRLAMTTPASVGTSTPASSGGGVASFYTEDSQTASGEKYDPHELTAAHPSLPFGTRLRVTNTTTGKSVTVRVNDRGPYVQGRVVDVSYSAAQALGMVNSGVAKVKLDVVQ
jgi:rare lipoprotein A